MSICLCGNANLGREDWSVSGDFAALNMSSEWVGNELETILAGVDLALAGDARGALNAINSSATLSLTQSSATATVIQVNLWENAFGFDTVEGLGRSALRGNWASNTWFGANLNGAVRVTDRFLVTLLLGLGLLGRAVGLATRDTPLFNDLCMASIFEGFLGEFTSIVEVLVLDTTTMLVVLVAKENDTLVAWTSLIGVWKEVKVESISGNHRRKEGANESKSEDEGSL